MLLKIYFGLWSLVATVAAVLLVTGNITNLSLVVVGFLCMPLIFAGMIIVLPLTMMHSGKNNNHIDNKPSKGKVSRSLVKMSDVWTVNDMSVRRLDNHQQAGF